MSSMMPVDCRAWVLRLRENNLWRTLQHAESSQYLYHHIMLRSALCTSQMLGRWRLKLLCRAVKIVMMTKMIQTGESLAPFVADDISMNIYSHRPYTRDRQQTLTLSDMWKLATNPKLIAAPKKHTASSGLVADPTKSFLWDLRFEKMTYGLTAYWWPAYEL